MGFPLLFVFHLHFLYQHPLFRRSWAVLGAALGCLGASWGALVTLLGRSWGCLGPSWIVLDCLGAVLGCLKISWSALGVILGWSWAVLDRLGSSWSGLGPDFGRGKPHFGSGKSDFGRGKMMVSQPKYNDFQHGQSFCR